MKTLNPAIWAAAAAILTAGAITHAQAPQYPQQSGSTVTGTPSPRSTPAEISRERERRRPGQSDAKKTGAKASPTPQAGQPAPPQPQAAAPQTTGPAAGQRQARDQKTAGGKTASALPGGAGQVKEVTRGFVESTRTRKVDYDEDKWRERPGVVILNSRKLEQEKSVLQREAERAESIAKPL